MPRPRNLPDTVVLDRAVDLFWRNGYAATSLRDLTEATGLSTAALYHRFVDKDGLFVAVLCRYADEGLNDRLARLAALTAPLEAIRCFLDEIIALSLEDRDRRGCLLVNTALDGAAMSDTARQTVRARFSEVEAFFARCLRRAVADGTLDRDTSIDTAATALLGAVFAIRVMARLDPDAGRLRGLASHAMASLPGGQATIPAPVPATLAKTGECV